MKDEKIEKGHTRVLSTKYKIFLPFPLSSKTLVCYSLIRHSGQNRQKTV